MGKTAVAGTSSGSIAVVANVVGKCHRFLRTPGFSLSIAPLPPSQLVTTDHTLTADNSRWQIQIGTHQVWATDFAAGAVPGQVVSFCHHYELLSWKS
jgi:hypothetical protein